MSVVFGPELLLIVSVVIGQVSGLLLLLLLMVVRIHRIHVGVVRSHLRVLLLPLNAQFAVFAGFHSGQNGVHRLGKRFACKILKFVAMIDSLNPGDLIT